VAARARTAKKLAQRIDLGYLQRPHPFRRWRFLLSAAAPALALLWLGWLLVRGDQGVYSGGPMSPAHAAFGEQCTLCHVSEAGRFRRHADDAACRACHDGPVHHANQTFTPACADCHVEHRGVARLAATEDSGCARCHARLATRSGTPQFEAAIASFSSRHPEFAPLRSGRPDPGAIKLNHEVHLKPGLRGPHGAVQMACADCHRLPGEDGAWPYGEEKYRGAALSASDPREPALPGAFMAPLKYGKHCAACHSLLFDERIAEPAPHEKPEVVRAFVERKLRDYIARHPEELGRRRTPERRLPGGPPAEESTARTPADWVAQRQAAAERLLWNKTCKECHTLRFTAGRPPEVAPAAMTARWLPHAAFTHESHRLLACAGCHARAPTSRETSDVLLPSIDACRQCHQAGAADARCSRCHLYHDWSKRRPAKGGYTLRELRGGD